MTKAYAYGKTLLMISLTGLADQGRRQVEILDHPMTTQRARVSEKKTFKSYKKKHIFSFLIIQKLNILQVKI